MNTSRRDASLAQLCHLLIVDRTSISGNKDTKSQLLAHQETVVEVVGAQGTQRFWRSMAEPGDPPASFLVLSCVVLPLWKSCIENICIKRKGRKHTGRVNLYLLILNVLQLLTTFNLHMCVAYAWKRTKPTVFGVHGSHHHVLSESWKDFSLHLLCSYC